SAVDSGAIAAASTLGMGQPIDPGLVRCRGLRWLIAHVSESPYPSVMLDPVRRAQPSVVLSCRVSAPERTSLRRRQFTLSVSLCSFRYSKSVGTPKKTVAW